MRTAATIAALIAIPTAGQAYADYVCTTLNGTLGFVIDLSNETITQDGFDPLSFEPAEHSAYPVRRGTRIEMVGLVDVPTPDHIVPGATPVGFALIYDHKGKLLLIENFADRLPLAFAPIEEVMEMVDGIPCSPQEAD